MTSIRSWSRRSTLTKSVIAGAAVIAPWLVLRSGISTDAKEHLETIRRGLEGEVTMQRLCLHAGPFPYRPGRSPGVCERCEDFYVAGLVTRPKDANIYELTDLGRELHTTEPDPDNGDRQPRFCFGRTKFHRLTKASRAQLLGDQRLMRIEYIAEAQNVHPLLFDPQTRVLGLPLPSAGSPALLPAVRANVFLSYGGKFLWSENDSP